jgi:hypothetical protein
MTPPLKEAAGRRARIGSAGGAQRYMGPVHPARARAWRKPPGVHQTGPPPRPQLALLLVSAAPGRRKVC